MKSVMSVYTGKRSISWEKTVEKMTPYLLVLPALVSLFIFTLLPLIMTLLLSATNWNLISDGFDWIAFENYKRLMSEHDFWNVVKNTFVFSFFSVGFTLIFAILSAVLLDKKIMGVRFFRSFMFLPYITPMVAISTVWIWMFDQHFGLINWVLGLFRIGPAPWLTKPGWAITALIIMKIWKVLGYYTIMLLAGMQNIPDHLYEAARIDGAGEGFIFRKITLPLLSPYILFVMIVAIIASFQDFDQIFMMTRGGPANSTNMIIYYLYQFGFNFFEVGYACSVAVILFTVLFLITWFQMYISKKWVNYL